MCPDCLSKAAYESVSVQARECGERGRVWRERQSVERAAECGESGPPVDGRREDGRPRRECVVDGRQGSAGSPRAAVLPSRSGHRHCQLPPARQVAPDRVSVCVTCSSSGAVTADCRRHGCNFVLLLFPRRKESCWCVCLL